LQAASEEKTLCKRVQDTLLCLASLRLSICQGGLSIYSEAVVDCCRKPITSVPTLPNEGKCFEGVADRRFWES